MSELAVQFPDCVDSSKPRIALFTDTLSDVNGVALTLHRLLDAARTQGTDLTIITCNGDPEGLRDGVMNFTSVGDMAVPEYPELLLHFPPVLDVLDFIERERFTQIHVSTPGTMGLLGLAAAHLLDLPVSGSYHTDLPRYVHRLTNDEALEELAWGMNVWFHSQLDELLVPSEATMQQLVEHGLPRSFMRPMPRWVDVERFRPDFADQSIWTDLGVDGKVKLLYAGRVSREKDLELLAGAFRGLVDAGHDVSLVVAGDGPYRGEMTEQLSGYPATFLGFLRQDELAVIYASADLLVFPSSTDTFGNVVLEAQACGLPVVVSDEGGPQELVLRDESGLVLPARDERVWTRALADLVEDDERLRRMRVAAREFVVQRAMAPEDHFSTLLSPDRARPVGADQDNEQRPAGPGAAGDGSDSSLAAATVA